MKILKDGKEGMYLTKEQWRKIFTAMSFLTFGLYVIAMIFSLCGSKYFILNYQNTQMELIENWFRNYHIYGLINLLFSVLEFSIIIGFMLNKFPNPLYSLAFYIVGILVAIFLDYDIVYNIYPFIFYFAVPIIDQAVYTKKIDWKLYGKTLLRLLIAIAITLILQIMIYVIKSGNWSFEYVYLSLTQMFIYSLEYDIALLVFIYTMSLYINREKGDGKLWVTDTVHGGSSQTTKKNSLKLSSELKKNLTKTQRNRLIWFWIRFYAVQILGFLLLMVLPFLLGKVLEFLMMYLSFAIARYILGFKYSLHFKKENVCITVGALVFGILTLAVPFFYVVVIIAVVFGVGLAVLLHLSYKYKGMYLFNLAAKPDKFALLYTYFDGDLELTKVRNKCRLRGLDDFQINLVADFVEGNKIMYLAKKYNYSQRMLIYKLDEAIEKLTR